MQQGRPSLTTWFNLRTALVICAVALVLLPQRPVVMAWLDNTLFHLAAELMQSRPATFGIGIIDLPDEEVGYLEQDRGRAKNSYRVVSRLLNRGGVTVGVLLPNPPRTQTLWAESLLRELSDDEKVAKQVDAAAKNFLTTQNAWNKYVGDQRVIVGVSGGDGPLSGDAEANALITEPSTATEYIKRLPGWMRPVPGPLVDSTTQGVDRIRYWPVANNFPSGATELTYQLLWQSGSGTQEGFLLRLYRQFAKMQHATWRQYEGLALDSLYFPLSADGSFIPLYNRLPQRIDTIHHYSLAQAQKKLPAEKIVLLGAAESPLLDQIAGALLSLEHQAYFYQPAWFVALETALIVLALLYLTLLLPRMVSIAGVLASCLIVVILLVAQVGWQITQWKWLPLGVVVQFIVLGHVFILLWKQQRDKLLQAQATAHGARYQLGLQLFRDGRADDALLAIRDCYPSDAVLHLMYDIASQQERKRQYSAAIKTYQAINEQKKQFKDVAEKVEKLIAFSSGTLHGYHDDADIAKTLIVSETTINKPVLGRYEIERELGRGAMGVVYLGRDPRIGRQVAIKTLSYSHVDPKQLDEFKERFFREAEAAGRLSHPNIVTIYDVGEEHDLAFIAMDYIEGESLSAYVSQDTLLPVKKVYQIVAEVAEGLGYAHDKNIIHRDIKPGNILYQPQNDVVKVTDFGVARIVDNARTNTGDILGSPLYMSPEQLKGDKVWEPTDIYSLGVTFYQLLTGAVPFSGDSLANLTYNILHEKHKGVREIRSDLPKSATRIINRALQKDPAKRYHSIIEMAETLRKSLVEEFH